MAGETLFPLPKPVQSSTMPEGVDTPLFCHSSGPPVRSAALATLLRWSVDANPSLQTLQTRKPRGSRAHITLFGTFDPDLPLMSPGARLRPGIIEDPYYGGRDGFDRAYDQCVRYARGFLDFLEAGGGEPPKL